MPLLYAHFTGHLSAVSKLSPIVSPNVFLCPHRDRLLKSGEKNLKENGWVWGSSLLNMREKVHVWGSDAMERRLQPGHMKQGLAVFAWSGDKQFLMGERQWLRKDKSGERRKELCLDRMDPFSLMALHGQRLRTARKGVFQSLLLLCKYLRNYLKEKIFVWVHGLSPGQEVTAEGCDKSEFLSQGYPGGWDGERRDRQTGKAARQARTSVTYFWQLGPIFKLPEPAQIAFLVREPGLQYTKLW